MALEMFVQRGFEETTVDDIAAALGVGRRTVFRNFDSKNDIVWGNFSWVLNRLRAELAESTSREPIIDALARAVIASNRYSAEELPELRNRMSLITSVPALQAHSMIRYADWRAVVAEFVAERTGEEVDALVPQAVGHAALAASMAAFTHWVHRGGDLDEALTRSWAMLASGFRDLPIGAAFARV